MREKLVFILRNPLLTLDDRTDQTLSLLIEEIKKAGLTDAEQDSCTPIDEQLEKYLAEPDDTVAAELRLQYPKTFRIIGRCILYGRNIRQAQLQKILKKMEEK